MNGRESRSKYNESLAPVKGDKQVMGMSVMWRSRPESAPTSFPDIDSGIEFNEDRCYYVRNGDYVLSQNDIENHVVYPHRSTTLDDPSVKKRIKALDVQHME